MARLLVIDSASTTLGEVFSAPPLADEPWFVERSRWDTFAVEICRLHPADVIVAAASPAEAKLADLFAFLRGDPRGSATIVAVAHDVDRIFVRHCLSAADDFILCPVRPDELHHRIVRILGPNREAGEAVRARLNVAHGLASLVGVDPGFVREVARIPLAARTNCEVLIIGETGTGKELCARALHHLSRRSALPFVCADCAALPDHLFENEMFGHERGAFTDAHRSQKGLVAVAEGGTLFLDEVDSLSLPAQAKLLRLVQDHTYKPLGSERFNRADVRIVAATNKNLEHLVDAGTFRRDLYFRLNVLRIHMMPLRERRVDIPMLADHFLEQCCAEMGCRPKRLASSSMQLLASLDWPGNVRELYNLIRRAVVFCDGSQMLPAHLMLDRDPGRDANVPGSFRSARATALQAFERRYVEDMLRRHHGNVTRAAEEAGKDRRVFGRMIKRLQIDRTTLGLPSRRPGVGRPGPTVPRSNV